MTTLAAAVLRLVDESLLAGAPPLEMRELALRLAYIDAGPAAPAAPALVVARSRTELADKLQALDRPVVLEREALARAGTSAIRRLELRLLLK